MREYKYALAKENPARPRGKRFEHHFWQYRRRYNRNIDSSGTLQEPIDDIYPDTVRVGLVECTRDWKWSSAGWFEENPPNHMDPIPWYWMNENGGMGHS